ncbi:MAG: RNA methyltransferase [Acidimicrobiia bacterium]
MTDPITSPSNPRIKALVRLRNRRERDRSGRFLVEGYRELSRALGAGIVLDELYVAPGLFLGHNEAALVAQAAATGTEIIDVADAAFARASYRDRPEGLIAVARQFPAAISDVDLSGNPLILVVEGIEKPGNLGTMLRTADAAGATAVIVADPSTDPFNPNVVRASLGTLFTVPIAVTDSVAAIDWLRANRVQVLAATPLGAMPHHSVDLTGPTALVVGSEQYGLSDAWLEAADSRIVIRMPGSVDSLNAAMAAGILLFEAVRQREHLALPDRGGEEQR